MPFIEHAGKRILFVHVPKTGGTTIERWFESIAPLRLYSVGIPAPMNITPQHLRFSDITAILGDGYFDYAFMIVRNPFARIASEYRMRLALNEIGFYGRGPKFSVWLDNALQSLDRNPQVLDNHLRPQWEFLGNDLEVFRLEEGMDSIMSKVAKRIGVSPPSIARHYYETEARSIGWQTTDILKVSEVYKRDFQHFKYDDSTPPNE